MEDDDVLRHELALLILENVGKCSNVWQDLNCKFVAVPQSILWCSAHSNTRRGTSNDDGSRRKSGALRQPANNLWDGEDEITWECSALLVHLAILKTSHVKFGRLGFAGCLHNLTERESPVEALGE
ncbi:hypothetical protein HG531_004253 [Fusarium graminearum]|nr:hypothetical protein HG531_004253 [Fusarium graminearum]